MKLIEKFLNKKVCIAEKMFSYSSTLEGFSNGRNFIEGVVTNIDDDFIELDNEILIAIKFIYKIQVIK